MIRPCTRAPSPLPWPLTRRGTAGPISARDVLPSNAAPVQTESMSERQVDLLVVGAGPAGMAAALVAAIEGLDVLVCEKSGQAGGTGSEVRDSSTLELARVMLTASICCPPPPGIGS